MVSRIVLLGILLLFVYCTDARVNFTHSTLYDIYDFEGAKEIPLPHCTSGCLIYASTTVNKDAQDGMDPYVKNLLIYDPLDGKNLSIAELSFQLHPGTLQKTALDISVNRTYSINNLNAPDAKGSDVTVYVVERATALAMDYAIYDAAMIAESTPRSIITFMSAAPFRVIAEPGEFLVNGPIIYIVFKERSNVNIKADLNYGSNLLRDISKSGFITSPGYNGCERAGGDLVHRAKVYRYSDEYDLYGYPNNYQLLLEQDYNLAAGNAAYVWEVTSDQIETFFLKTIRIFYNNLILVEGIIIRFTSALVNVH